VNRATRLLLLSSGLLACSTAMAAGYYESDYGRHRSFDDPNAYVGLNLGALQYSEDGLDTLTPNVGLVRFGVPLSRNLAIEGRAGGGFTESSSGGYGIKVDSIYAAYVKGSLPLSRTFALYAVGGIAGVDLRRDFGSPHSHESGLSAGVGADIYLGGGAGINVEWTRLPSGTNAGYDFTQTMATIGMTWRF
jgi:hypothetical protein